MVIATAEGQVYQNHFDWISAPFRPDKSDADSYHAGRQEAKSDDESSQGREQVPLYRGGKDVTQPPKKPISPTPEGGPRGIHSLNIDRDHHVPLVASATMDDAGNMTGIAVDHRLNLSGKDEDLLKLHEATELPYMQDLIKGGKSPPDAYAEAHKWATARETAASVAQWGEEGHSQYQQRMRDAAAIAKEPTDRERHPDAHTTRYGLDESELGQSFKVAGDVVDFPHVPWQERTDVKDFLESQHPPLQIDVLSGKLPGATGILRGPKAEQMSKSMEDAAAVAKNFPKVAKSMRALDRASLVQSQYYHWMKPGEGEVRKTPPANENQIRTAVDDMEDLVRDNPQQYKYLRAMYKQRGGEDWDKWKQVETIIDGHFPKEGEERPSLLERKEAKPLSRFRTIEGGKKDE